MEAGRLHWYKSDHPSPHELLLLKLDKHRSTWGWVQLPFGGSVLYVNLRSPAVALKPAGKRPGARLEPAAGRAVIAGLLCVQGGGRGSALLAVGGGSCGDGTGRDGAGQDGRWWEGSRKELPFIFNRRSIFHW